MGMFSYICPLCNKPIVYAAGKYNECWLFLKEDGEVLESMQGSFDGYGRVYGQDWETDWNHCCDLAFSENDMSGFLYIHAHCYQSGVEHQLGISQRDPDQGWRIPHED